MLKRKMYSVLKKWKKDASKNALCLIGARQVGKTTIVREFAKHEYHQLVELNFLADPDAKKSLMDRCGLMRFCLSFLLL